MTPEQKVAILMVVLGEERAGSLLAQMPQELTRRVLAAIAKLDKVDEATVEQVIAETLKIYHSQKSGGVGAETARKIVDAASSLLGDPSFRNQLESGIVAQEITTTLAEIKASVTAQWLSHEHPSVAATVLSLASPSRAAEVFRALPVGQQPQVCLAIAELQSVNEAALADLLDEVRRLRERQTAELSLGGSGTVARLLQHLDPTLRQSLLDKLDEKDPALTEELRRQLLSPEKIASLGARDLGRVLATLADRELALVLKGSTESVRGAFLAAVSRNRGETLQDILSSMGPVRKSDVEAARQKLQATVERLHAEGAILLPWEDRLV